MARQNGTRKVNIGARQFTILGGRRATFVDLYHDSLAISWPRFFVVVAGVFAFTTMI